MIRISVKRYPDGTIAEYSITGHARYAGHGQDIVCSAVSGISIGMYNAIELLLGIELPVRQGKSGELTCWVPSDIPVDKRDKLQLLLEAMIISLGEIKKEYGSHVKLTETEIKGGGSPC